MFAKKKRSVQTTLQLAFFLLIVIVFVAYMIYFIVSESSRIKTRAFDSVIQDTETSSEFMDEEIKSVNTVMQNVAYSNLIKEHFLDYLNRPTATTDSYTDMQNIKVLTDLLTAIIGPNRPIDQIYLYSLESGCIGVGLDNMNSTDSVQNAAWYNTLMASDNNHLIFCDDDERLEKYFTYKEGSRFLTICSVYQSSFYKPAGIIEVKRSVSSLTEKLKKIDTDAYNEQIMIFDQTGNMIYNSGNDSDENKTDGIDYYSAILNSIIPTDGTVYRTDYGKNTHLFAKISSYSGFTTIVALNNSDVYRPINDYVRMNLLIFLGFVVVILILSFVVSRVITNPVMKMYSNIASLHKDAEMIAEESLEKIDTNIIELDTLYSAVIDMHERAQKSMQREISLNNQRLQSQILALQSQMNPHFLYNSLATIQAMADEGMNKEVVVMCQTISRILRYISSDKEPLVSISEDAAHAKDYLECMKMRYGDDLIYEINIPSEMLDLKIPKLCLQLIVENSIKFTTKSVKPPWKIKVDGVMTGIYWEITISDNGLGFSDEDIKELEEKIKYINENKLLPSLEINGMGLMNIYIRFKTMYHGKHIFKISNSASGGALVTIGGELDE